MTVDKFAHSTVKKLFEKYLMKNLPDIFQIDASEKNFKVVQLVTCQRVSGQHAHRRAGNGFDFVLVDVVEQRLDKPYLIAGFTYRSGKYDTDI